MMQWVNKTFPRPSPYLVDKFREIPTSILSDCMNRFMAMESSIQAIRTGTRLCGVAFTVQAMESSNWGAHHAVSLAEAGDVIVLDARSGMRSAVWGHVMTFAAEQRQLGGVVIDGCIRDADENKASQLPIYCRGFSPSGPHKGWRDNINVTISCGAVPVSPGDIIVGDDDGIVVVPQNRISEVLEEANQRLQTEDSWYAQLRTGKTTVEILNLPPIEG